MTRDTAVSKDIEIGAIVHVRGKVIGPRNADVVLVKGTGEAFWALKCDIVHVETRSLQVGDIVRCRGSVTRWEVRAGDDEHAMPRRVLRDWNYIVYPIADLERVP